MLEPEVAGEFGENTKFDSNNKVVHLHFQFAGWLGDEILENTPCFIVTKHLANSINDANLTGVEFRDVEISLTDEFKEIYPNKILPEFKRLVSKGYVKVNKKNMVTNWSGDDFSTTDKNYLIISEKALIILKRHRIEYCDITNLKYT